MPYESRCNTGRTSTKVRATKSRRNYWQQMHPIHPIGPKLTFWSVSYCLVAFGTIWLPYKTRWITGRTSAKVRATKSRHNFRNERTQSTPLDPKLMFWCVLYHLGTFEIVWLPYESRYETGRTSAKVRATKSCWIFSQRTHPIHSIGP